MRYQHRLMPKRFHIKHQIAERLGAYLRVTELGHRSQAMAHLKPQNEARNRLVIEGRPKSCGSAGMALVALGHEDALADFKLTVGDVHLPRDQGIAT